MTVMDIDATHLNPCKICGRTPRIWIGHLGRDYMYKIFCNGEVEHEEVSTRGYFGAFVKEAVKEWNNENPVPETQENSERNIEMNENEEFISHCPFCGSEHWEHYGKQVRCCKCGATGPNFVTAKENVNELDDEFKHVLGCEEFVNGIMLWNIRAEVFDQFGCSPLHPFTHPEWERKHNAETEDGTTAEQITQVTNDLRDTLIRKNHDYGNSALQPGILCPDCDATTLIRARMSDKINRLSSLVSGKQAEVKESLEDTVKDLAGYCVLWLMAMGEKDEKDI